MDYNNSFIFNFFYIFSRDISFIVCVFFFFLLTIKIHNYPMFICSKHLGSDKD